MIDPEKNKDRITTEKEKSFQRTKRMVASLVISVVTWVLIVNVVNPEITVKLSDIPVDFVGESELREKGFVVVDREEIPDFSLKVRGTRKDLLSGMKNITVEADVTGINKQGKSTVSTRINIPEQLSVQEQAFSSVDLVVEPRYDKAIPVIIEQLGDEELAVNKKIVSSVPDTREVIVSGSVSDVEQVKACVVTVDVTRVHGDGKLAYEYRLVDNDDKEISEETSVYCSNSVIGVTNVIYNRYTVDVDVDVNPLLKRRYKVEYDIKDLNMKTVDIGVVEGAEVPEKISAVLANKEYAGGESTVDLEVKPLDGVYIPENPITLKVNFTPMNERETTVDVELKNIPDKLKSQKKQQTVQMELIIPDGVNEEDIKATIDCSSFKAGDNEGKIVLNDSSVEIVKPKKITVKLEEKDIE